MELPCDESVSRAALGERWARWLIVAAICTGCGEGDGPTTEDNSLFAPSAVVEGLAVTAGPDAEGFAAWFCDRLDVEGCGADEAPADVAVTAEGRLILRSDNGLTAKVVGITLQAALAGSAIEASGDVSDVDIPARETVWCRPALDGCVEEGADVCCGPPKQCFPIGEGCRLRSAPAGGRCLICAGVAEIPVTISAPSMVVEAALLPIYEGAALGEGEIPTPEAALMLSGEVEVEFEGGRRATAQIMAAEAALTP